MQRRLLIYFISHTKALECDTALSFLCCTLTNQGATTAITALAGNIFTIWADVVLL